MVSDSASSVSIAPWRLIRLKKLILEEGVIAYPTEGVWGLGCLPQSEKAVTRIAALKQRSLTKGLILVAANIDQFEPYLNQLDSSLMAVLQANWPGPVTYLVPDNGRAPRWIKGAHKTVALRVSDHPVVRELCLAIEGPLVSTSANTASHPPARDSLQVRRYFAEGIDDICPGELGDEKGASEIRSLTSIEVVRSKA